MHSFRYSVLIYMRTQTLVAYRKLYQELSQNVAVGFVINNPSVHLSFPTDDSKASKLARLNAASDTLQNISGPGKGCPIVSTTFQAQAAAINAEPGP